MMDASLIALVVVGSVGIFFLLLIFVLPRRKLPEESRLKALYQEQCSMRWRASGGIQSGGNLPIARLSFYDDFFVVSMLSPVKINYSEIIALSAVSGFFSKSITVDLGRRKLILHPNDFKKVGLLFERLAGVVVKSR